MRPAFLVFGAVWQFWRNLAQIPQIKGWETRKVIQSLQLFIAHQILKCQDHLSVKSYLFERALGPLGTI